MKKNEFVTAYFIAKKNLMKNKNALFLTIVIISLGFISSTIIYGILNDVRGDLTNNYIETSVGDIVLEPYGNNDQLENTPNLVKQIKSLPYIIGIASITKKTARMYDSNNDYIDAPIYVINPRDFAEVSVVDDIIKEGSYLNKGEKNNIIMGCINTKDCNKIEAFERIDVRVGENIITVFNSNAESQFSLQGIYDHQDIQAERISYISQDTAKEIFPDYDSSKADLIIIRLPNKNYVEKTIEELVKLNINAKISTGEEKASLFLSTVDSFYLIGNMSFFIGVLISAISIYIILYINILNKRTQIGIIKAVGIKSKIILTSYIILSLFLGLIGSLMGIILTLIVIQYFTFNPVSTGVGNLVPQIPITIFLMVFGTITLASVLSGYLVSKRITKQNIIESIFHG